MKAVVLTEFGPAENLELRDLETPHVGPTDVLVRVHATSVNLADVGVRSGVFGAMLKTPLVLGFDAAGVVEAVGAAVTDLTVGDESLLRRRTHRPARRRERRVSRDERS